MPTYGVTREDLQRYKSLIISGTMPAPAATDYYAVDGDYHVWSGSDWVPVPDVQGTPNGVEPFSSSEVGLVRSLLLNEGNVPGNSYASARESRAQRLKSSLQFPGPTVYFDFSEQFGSSTYDRLSQRVATLNAGSVVWTPRGVLFTGTGAFQFAAGVMDALAGTICDLSTLTGDECITAAFVYHHSTAMTGQHPLFYYGCSGEATCGGWGIVARTDAKLFFHHRPVGSSVESVLNLDNHNPANTAANNTRTAVCLEISRHPDDPKWLEIRMHDRPLESSAEIQSVLLSYTNPTAVGDGTGPAKYSTLGPLTIGGKPGATYTNLTPQLAGNGGQLCGLQMLALQRYRYVPGRYSAILNDLAADPTSPPTSLFMEV